MKKWILTLTATLFSAAVFTGCHSQPHKTETAGEAIPVVVSFNAMKEFTEAVGKEKVHVVTIIPDGTEPHDFQPTTKQLKELSGARLFICNGLGMEPWAEKTIEAVGNDALTLVEASRGIEALSLSDGVYDPHCWLSLKEAQVEVANIAEALAQADPGNAEFYRRNAASYNGQLQDLLAEYQEKFRNLPRRQFVTGHAAFAYICRDFGLTQSSVSPVFSGGEPGAQQLAQLAAYCRENGVKTVFTEAMVSPKISETLAREVGASIQPIYTMESADGGLTYVSRMKDNLENIYASLQ